MKIKPIVSAVMLATFFGVFFGSLHFYVEWQAEKKAEEAVEIAKDLGGLIAFRVKNPNIDIQVAARKFPTAYEVVTSDRADRAPYEALFNAIVEGLNEDPYKPMELGEVDADALTAKIMARLQPQLDAMIDDVVRMSQ